MNGTPAPTPIIYLIVVRFFRLPFRATPRSRRGPFFVLSPRNRPSRYHPFVVLLRGFPPFCQLRDGGSKLRFPPPPSAGVSFTKTFSHNECLTTRNDRHVTPRCSQRRVCLALVESMTNYTSTYIVSSNSCKSIPCYSKYFYVQQYY